MIIKTGTIKAGDGPRICSYVTRQGDNEHVHVLKDSSDQLLVADDFAQLKNRKNGLLHVIISPNQELTPAEWEKTLNAIRAEFGFNPDDPNSFVIHESRRADGTIQKHGHFVGPAADSATGKTYKMYKSKCRDEVVSRFLELEFGHKLVSGAHNNFVAQRFEEMGREDYAARIEKLADASWSAFNSNEHQQAKRQNFDLPVFRQQLKVLSERAPDQQPRALAELIHDQGLELADAITVGRGRSRINIELGEGIKPHNANRTLKIKAAEVAAFIEATQENLHDLRSDAPKPDLELERNPVERSTLGDHQRTGADSPEQPNHDPAAERIAEGNGGDSQDSPENRLTDEAAELAQAAADLKPQAVKFAANRGDDLTAADIDAPPDLSDPNLMKKLAAMLKKSLSGATRVAARVLSPNQGMPG